ncbi:MAG: 3-hydroxy-3-methylglutaryl-CoA synthase [Candidatus Aenigmarchaeota archaeon]|nr:3-hydroxy-3-methylglutaryl-CoA synthase [Candidatus Aenigmarchaeota archaeon]
MAAGIDDITFFGPRLYLDTSVLEEVRFDGKKKGLISKGLGLNKEAMNDSNQDAATNAANAVRMLMKKNDVLPSQVERLEVATESSFDESKGMNSYVIGMLEKFYGAGSLGHCGGVEHKFACVAGSYALESAVSLVNGRKVKKDKYQIVVVTDTAKYDLRSPGELTQGTGALAMLVKDSPRIIEMESDLNATSIKNLTDFHRPFGKETPNVYGEESELAYLLQTKDALDDYKRNAIDYGIAVGGKPMIGNVGYINAHIPYPKMAEKALVYLLRHAWRGTEKMKSIEARIGPEPLPEGGSMESFFFNEKFVDHNDHRVTPEGSEFLKRDNEFSKKLRGLEEYQEIYKSRLESSLKFPSEIGNIYTGSMYLAFRSTVENEFRAGVDMSGKRVLFISYGSGANSMVFSGLMADRSKYTPVVRNMDFFRELGERVPLTYQQYEDLHEKRVAIKDSMLGRKEYEGQFVLREVGNGERRYALA